MKSSLKWLLAFSVILNIVLMGFAAGRMMHRPLGRPWEEKIDALPADKQKLFDQMREESKARREEDSQKIMALRREVVAILSAPHFDEQQFIAKSQELSAIFAENKREMIHDMAALARQCNQEERKVLAKHLKRPPPPPMGPPDR